MNIYTVTLRLFLSVILSGLIGMEREEKNRPAGFRTHILVCVASALVMMTSEYAFERFKGIASMDLMRLGAQVISGIGFLGAGTIIHEGTGVKGLTTAASLWAVACIGLAVGIGFYQGAIIGSIMIYLTLMLLGRFGGFIHKKNLFLTIDVEMRNSPGKIGEIGSVLGKHSVDIKNIKFITSQSTDDDDDDDVAIRLTLKLPHGLAHSDIIKEIARIKDISKVEDTY